MADYQRYTALPAREVLSRADEILAERAGLHRSRESRHAVTYSGQEGLVTLEAHRHGAMTDVIARTNQLRTSKIDMTVRHLLNQLPYQPGDDEEFRS
jgi:hypothetical protein